MRNLPTLAIGVVAGTLVTGTTLMGASAVESQPYAFAEQPTQSCGFIQLNYIENTTWTVEGQSVEVTPPATRLPYPNGTQAEVVATYPDGTETFYLTVNPCRDYAAEADAAKADAAYWRSLQSTTQQNLDGLRGSYKFVVKELSWHKRQLSRKERVIKRLRDRIARLR